jgi:glycosyltransferase involved in cell wall biosynthesis
MEGTRGRINHLPESQQQMTMSLPVVAVCLPSSGSWKAKTGIDLISLCCYSLSFANIAPVHHENSSIGDGRNHMVMNALKLWADYIFFVDTDMVFPPDGLERLMKHNLDIVGATYNRRVKPYDTLGVWEPFDLKPDGTFGVVKASKAPTGFLLIKADVFRKLKGPPWFFEAYGSDIRCDRNPTGHMSDDYVFMTRAVKEGFQPYIDFDLSFDMGHIGEQIITLEKPKIEIAV